VIEIAEPMESAFNLDRGQEMSLLLAKKYERTYYQSVIFEMEGTGIQTDV
jgi:hypothetical protein